jgi:cytolysin (calcineurin-like family phosphatase)
LESGFLSKHEVDIDRHKFKIADVRGYQLKGDYFARMGTDFIKRIVHGRLNVYINQYSSSNYDSKTNRVSYDTRCEHYLQKGETGELTPLASISDIQEAVSDCPKGGTNRFEV